MEELELIEKFKKLRGDKEPKDPLTSEEKDIVEFMWKKYKGLIYKMSIKMNKKDPSALVSVGIFSLIYSMQKYDASRTMKFHNYLCWAVKRDLVRENLYNGVHMPHGVRQILYRFKKEAPLDIDKWISSILPNGQKYETQTIKNAILKYKDVKYVVEQTNEEFQTQYLRIDSFEEESLDKLSIPTDLMSDIEKVVGKTYTDILKLKVVDELKLHQIAEIMNCSKNNIHIKLKRTMNKLNKCEWFTNKYKSWEF